MTSQTNTKIKFYERTSKKKKLGVLRLDGWGNPQTTGTGVSPKHATEENPFTGYVPIDGDIDAKGSYDFGFIAEVANGCTFEALCNPAGMKDPDQIKKLLPGVVAAIKKLVEQGAQAIIGNCGLFMWLHATGLIEHAVDKVMEDLGDDYIRPYAMLSSLTTLGSSLATLGVGEGQEKALADWNISREQVPLTAARKCKVVVFTSNGDSCKVLLKAIPQLQGLKVFTSDEETEGDVLVVGLNGVVNGKKVPVIGLEGVSENGQVGGESPHGFNAVATGQSVLYEIVQPGIMLVAKAVKKTYPNVCMAYVECTEVSAYSDTIREAMRVPVHDPIHTAYGMIHTANNHNFSQLGNKDRYVQIGSILQMPKDELVRHGALLDALPGLAQLPDEGASEDPLYDERRRARAMQIQTAKNIKSEALQALQERREKLGDSHPDTLTSIDSMGKLLQEMGKLEEARPLLKEALQTRRDTLDDPRHPDTLRSINNMATLLQAMGKLEEARLLYKEALQGRRETLGDRHPDTLVSINNMGGLLADMGKLEEAMPLYEEDLQASRETLGDRHPSTLISIGNMGSLLLKAMGKLEEAKPLYEGALQGCRAALGESHPNTLTSINNMGQLLQAMGKLEEAMPLLEEALQAKRETLGDRHPGTLISIGSMGSLLQGMGKLEEAMPLFEEALQAHRETLGDRHPGTLISIGSMGSLLQDMGQLEEARPLYEEALQARRETLGDRHPKTLISIQNMTGLLQAMGKRE